MEDESTRALCVLGVDGQKQRLDVKNTQSPPPEPGGASIRIRNGAPSRNGCVVSGHVTKASSKLYRE